MQIFSVVYEDPVGATSGFGRVALRLSESFSRQGVESHIICTLRQETANFVSEEIVNGVAIHKISISDSPLSRIKFYSKAQMKLDNLCKRSERKVLILNSAYSLPLARTFQKKGLVVYHTFGTLLYELFSSISGIINPFNYRKLFLYSMDIATETAFLGFTNILIVPHNRAADEFRKIYSVKAEKIHVVPYGQDVYSRYHDADFLVEVEAFRNKFAHKKLILFVGGSDWHRKGAPYMLQAFNAIKDKLPASLIMTGKPVTAYLSLARTLGLRLGEDIILTGFVDDRMLAKLYAACDVFSLPSFHEGFSQPVIEVMAYGKPVVVSQLAAYPTVEDGREGFVIYPNDTNSYAEALQKILTNENLYAAMSKKAKLKAQNYSWDKIGLEFLALFQSPSDPNL